MTPATPHQQPPTGPTSTSMGDLDTLTRKPERGSHDRHLLDALLDEVLVATASTVSPDGQPWVVPLLFARDQDTLLLHGSAGAGMLRHLATGAPLALSMFTLDGLVLAPTVFDSSANYRSAVIRGTVQIVPDHDKDTALRTLTNRLFPGRVAEVPPNTPKELAATTVLAMQITDTNWIYKARTGPEPQPAHPDHTLWTGTITTTTIAHTPTPDPWVAPTTPQPPSVTNILNQHPHD